MRKTTVLLLLLVFTIVGVWFYLNRNPQPSALRAMSVKKTDNALTNLLDDNVASSSNVTSSPSIVAPTTETFNALTATNLEQWKASVKDLVQLGGIQFHQSWIFEQQKLNGKGADRDSGIPIILSQNGKMITYTATFINLATKNGSDNDLLEVELYSPNMNINQTRELGLQLCDMLQIEPNSFLAWCDKVGNHWMDMPLYGTRGNRRMGFKILNTFNNEKPWSIDFIMASP